MARAMQWIDVFDILLHDGYICNFCDSYTGKSTITIHERKSCGINEEKGHITNRQFEELYKRKLIKFIENTATGKPLEKKDKQGNILTFFKIDNSNLGR